MADTKITTSLRVNSGLKHQVDELCAQLGISFSTAVTGLLNRFVSEKRLLIALPDTHIKYYDDSNSYEVNESMQTVRDVVASSLKQHG